MNSRLLFHCLIAFVFSTHFALAGDWMTWRSSYTHDPLSGQRVDQYAPAVEPIAPDQGNLVRSGYRHYRSTIQAGQSADNLHVVHEWGRPVAPYEHWRFPFRPYGAPYDAWGPQTPNVLNSFSFGNHGFGSRQHPPYGASAYGAPATQPGTGSGGMPSPGSGQHLSAPYYNGQHPGAHHHGSNSVYGGYQPQPTFPLVPPYQPAPWNDGLYPSAPALSNQPDSHFFYRPPSSMRP